MEAKKKLLVLTSTFPRWDQDTDPPFVFDLCKRLLHTYTVHVLCPHTKGSATQECFHGIHVTRFRYFREQWQVLAYEGGILNRLRQNPVRYLLIPFFIAGELMATVRLLRNQRIDVLNAHWLLPQGLIAVVAKMMVRSSVPVVCTLHGGDVFGLGGLLVNALKRFVLSRSSAVSVVSQAMRREIISRGADAGRIHVIPMGVDLKKTFIPTGKPRQKKSLLFVGRLVEKKGLQYLIEAMPPVLQKHPDAHLTIIGHGPEEPAIRRCIAELRLQDSVTMRGAVENARLPAAYQSAEVVIFPSIVDRRGDTEGFGLVMVEALGCECAVVASDLPPAHDIIIHHKTGVFVEQKNAGHIAQVIISLLDRPEKTRSLAAAGRAYVLERYDWEIIAGKYRAVFEELMHHR